MSKQEESFAYRLFKMFPDFDPKWPDKIKLRWLKTFSTLAGVLLTQASKGTRKT